MLVAKTKGSAAVRLERLINLLFDPLLHMQPADRPRHSDDSVRDGKGGTRGYGITVARKVDTEDPSPKKMGVSLAPPDEK